MGFATNLTPLLLTLPILFLKFWFFEGPQLILKVTGLLLRAAGDIFSLPILLRTFFSPWKGEYRRGYVGIARGVGVVVRFFTILVALTVMAALGLGGLLACFIWIGAPIGWTLLFLQTLGLINFHV